MRLLKEDEQDSSIPLHIEPEKRVQMMYQLELGWVLLLGLVQDKQSLYLALKITRQLLKPIKE